MRKRRHERTLGVLVAVVAAAVIVSAGCGRGSGADQDPGADRDSGGRAAGPPRGPPPPAAGRTASPEEGNPATTTASHGPTTTVAAAASAAVASQAPSDEAHVASDLAADRRGKLVAPRPPEYQVTKDGTLIIGGDVLVGCGDLLMARRESPAPRSAGKAARAAMERSFREQVAACRAAGFPPKNR